MRRIIIIAIAACTPKQSPPVANHVDHGIEVGDLDRTADPCTDFYQFTTGGWRAANPIPPALPKWSRRAAAREANRRQLQGILDELSHRIDWPRGSAEQLVGDYYASCMDEAKADAAGATPLAPWLTEIEAARTPSDIQHAIRHLHEIAISVPFGVVGMMDAHAPVNFIADIVPGGLGLPDRDDYAKAETRDHYRAHIIAMLGLAGAADPTHDADAIISLETRLAGASLASAAAADPAATDHVMTFAQLEKLAPHFEWRTYFDDAHLPRADVNVAEPAYLQQLDNELATTPLAVWKAYLEWQLLHAAAPWLSKPFVDASFALTAAEPKPRARRCVDSTEALLADPLGKKYADKYFSSEAKAKALAIARTLMTALLAELPNVTWMQADTRTRALAKLATTRVEVGYPDHWKDYSTLAIRRDALWTNIAAARARGVADDRARIGKPTPRDLWQLPPSSPDAYLEPQLNQLVLPAGYLQRPVFDADATDAFNYGAIGIGLAHDLT
ncbi:MAG TPA: M13 family metallopeptidase, partial [Kofleriaceae bacterium]|nr:M13 family metallopeptidase [Kofleriaceae bacterium]